MAPEYVGMNEKPPKMSAKERSFGRHTVSRRWDPRIQLFSGVVGSLFSWPKINGLTGLISPQKNGVYGPLLITVCGPLCTFFVVHSINSIALSILLGASLPHPIRDTLGIRKFAQDMTRWAGGPIPVTSGATTPVSKIMTRVPHL